MDVTNLEIIFSYSLTQNYFEANYLITKNYFEANYLITIFFNYIFSFILQKKIKINYKFIKTFNNL